MKIKMSTSEMSFVVYDKSLMLFFVSQVAGSVTWCTERIGRWGFSRKDASPSWPDQWKCGAKG